MYDPRKIRWSDTLIGFGLFMLGLVHFIEKFVPVHGGTTDSLFWRVVGCAGGAVFMLWGMLIIKASPYKSLETDLGENDLPAPKYDKREPNIGEGA